MKKKIFIGAALAMSLIFGQGRANTQEKERALSNRIYSAVDNEWEIYIEGNAEFSDIDVYVFD